MDAGTLAEAMGCSLARAQQMCEPMNNAMLAAGCTTVNRAAMWCAQIGTESAGLVYMAEIADGSEYNWRADLGNTQPGDGPRYKGSGPIQLTGRANFRAFSAWCCDHGWVPNPHYFEDNPELVRSDPHWGFLAASWYWTVARPQINALCDAGDLNGVTRAINGGLNGIDDRRARWNRCRALGAALLPEEAFMAGLNEKEQRELLEKVRGISDQLGPKLPSWGADSSMGVNAKGEELTFRDGVAKVCRDVAAIAKKVAG